MDEQEFTQADETKVEIELSQESENTQEITVKLDQDDVNLNQSEEVSYENQESINEESIQQTIPTLTNIASALKSDLKAQVETILFVTDKPIRTGEIAKMLHASYEDVQSCLVQLIQEYEDRSGGLEIGTEEGYIIQVRAQYLNIVTEMMPLEISAGPLRTLSAITLKEPVLQSEIIDMRGSSAYEHISDLVEMDLITKKPQGLSYILKTTPKFKMYFRLSPEASMIKEKLQDQAKKLAKEREEKRTKEEEIRMKEAEKILEGTSS